MDDVIGRSGILNLEEHEALQYEKPIPSKKFPNWVTKTPKCVHPYEVENTGTQSLTRQKDVGDVDNSNLGDVDYMDVSYDFELNLSTNLESISFEEVVTCDEWKEAMKNEYDI